MNNANGGNILFHFKGDTSGLQKATSSIGSMTKSILVATGITKALSTAWNMVSSSTGDAIDRFDQLNAFPRVMKSLGISEEAANKATKKLADGLKGLPTTLNQGTTAVSRFVAKNGDVERSTEMFLALNNAIISGNAPMENQSAALEQMMQAYSKGKPDMMEWRSLMTAMPGQLKQVAKAMGYVNTDELYEALQNGTASMDDFMDAIMRLNKEGIDGLDSFQTSAKNAVGGIKTAMTNMKTAITRGVANIIDGLDKGLKSANIEGGIAGLFGKIGEGFEKGLTEIGNFIKTVLPQLLSGDMSFGDFGGLMGDKIAEGLKTGMEKLNEAIPEVLPKAIDFLSGLISALGQNLPELIPLAIEIVDNLVEQLTSPDAVQKMTVAGIDLGKGLIEGVVLGVDENQSDKSLGTILFNNFSNMLSWGHPLGSETGRSIMSGIVLGIMEKMGYPKEKLNQVKQDIETFIKNPEKVLFATGKAIIQSLVDGMKAVFEKLNIGGEIKKKIKDSMPNPKEWLKNIGKNIIQGLIDGIKSMIPGLQGIASSVAGIVSGIVAAKNKIHSPSKLFEYYGEMIGEGYINGIDSMKNAISKTAMDTFSISPQLANSMSLNNSPNVIVNNSISMETDPLGQTVSRIKTFSGGAKNDYNYGMGV